MIKFCKCGGEMVEKRRGGVWLGNDMFHLYEHESFWLVCPRRRCWNFWRHTAPIEQRATGE